MGQRHVVLPFCTTENDDSRATDQHGMLDPGLSAGHSAAQLPFSLGDGFYMGVADDAPRQRNCLINHINTEEERYGIILKGTPVTLVREAKLTPLLDDRYRFPASGIYDTHNASGDGIHLIRVTVPRSIQGIEVVPPQQDT